MIKKQRLLNREVLIMFTIIYLLMENFLYSNTDDFLDFVVGSICIFGLCFLIIIYRIFLVKFSWSKYLVYLLILPILLICIVINYHMLISVKGGIVLFSTILLVVWNITLEKDNLFKLITSCTIILSVIAIEFFAVDYLKENSKIGRETVDFAIEEGVIDNKEVDIIIKKEKEENQYKVSIFYGKKMSIENSNESTYENVSYFIYKNSEIIEIN